jgi:hypothetical protein
VAHTRDPTHSPRARFAPPLKNAPRPPSPKTKPKPKKTATQHIAAADDAASLAAIYGRPPPPSAAAGGSAAAEQAGGGTGGAPASPASRRGSAAGTKRPAPSERAQTRHTAEELERMTVRELQELLRAKGLGASGRKDALVTRLLDAQRGEAAGGGAGG